MKRGGWLAVVLGWAAWAGAAEPDLGAFVLECTDLPPFAEAIRQTTGRPVFDFVTLLGWIHSALASPSPSIGDGGKNGHPGGIDR